MPVVGTAMEMKMSSRMIMRGLLSLVGSRSVIVRVGKRIAHHQDSSHHHCHKLLHHPIHMP
jgi:hypothetical protein